MKRTGALAAISILGLLAYIAACAASDSPGKKDASSPELEKLIRQLGSHNFGEREAAERKLEAIGKPALAALRQAANEQSDPEVRSRIPRLIDRLGQKYEGRHVFAEKMGTLKTGMTKAQVLAALGKPDDIQPAGTPYHRIPHSEELWCYGTSGHLSFPTLGSICFDDNHTVQLIFGQGRPPSPLLFEEVELRYLLSILGQSDSPLLFDPLWAIKVVNVLQPLGKEKALAVIQEFDRVGPFRLNSRDLFLLLRVLFEVPDNPGFMPEWGLGSSEPKDPLDPKRIPRFPIAILDDVPLNLTFMVFYSGQPVPLDAHLDYYRDHGSIRTKPLHPTDKPLQIFTRLFKEYGWLYENRELGLAKSSVESQLQKLLSTVYRGEIEKGSLPRPVQWDTKRNMYTFLDGTTLPEDSAKKGTE
jgi:hypothetical protein